jgi:ketosteroid isomerase-like protein
MPEEPTTPDLVELVREQVEALGRGDVDGVMSSVAEDGVLDGRAELIEGRAAIRGFLEEWFGAYEELAFELEEVSHLGDGVVFAVVIQDGRLIGSAGRVRQREGWVYLFIGSSIARLTTSEVRGARAGAERLAEERGRAVSQENVETVRRAIAAINARNIGAYLACCTENVELLLPMAGAQYLGADGIKRFFTDIEHIGPDFRIEVERVQATADGNVLAFLRIGATGRASGVVTAADSANVYAFVDGKISRVRIFLDRDEAPKAVGLEE